MGYTLELEYGGYVSEKRARERHPVEYPPDEIIAKLKLERAVFDIDLLAQVARSRQSRAVRQHPSDSVNKKARAYPLSGITYCAHCEQAAQIANDPKSRSQLSGHIGVYYRHKPGGACGCKRQSVQREIYEADFFRLVKLLAVNAETIVPMKALAYRIEPGLAEGKDLETQRTEAIALCNRRIQAAVDLYSEGRIDRSEYQRRIKRNIASWQARTNDSEKLAMELTMCIHAVETLTRLWEVSDDEDKQGMARHLFEAIVYDLDQQEIVDFRLKPWADQFLVLRAALYAEEQKGELEGNENRMTLTGLRAANRFMLAA